MLLQRWLHDLAQHDPAPDYGNLLQLREEMWKEIHQETITVKKSRQLLPKYKYWAAAAVLVIGFGDIAVV